MNSNHLSPYVLICFYLYRVYSTFVWWLYGLNRVNLQVKTLSGTKPWVFSGNVAPGVAKVGSLFPRLRASIWRSWSCYMRICNWLWQDLLARLRGAKRSVMLRRSWQAGLQLEVAKCIVSWFQMIRVASCEAAQSRVREEAQIRGCSEEK